VLKVRKQKGSCDIIQPPKIIDGDPNGVRTRVTGVRGRRPNR
jgi:hypothetical protein